MTISFPVTVRENVPMAGLTTLGVGGPARFLAEVTNPGELREVLQTAREARLPVYFLGQGSNLLVADAGYDGLVIRYLEDSLRVVSQGDGLVHLRVGAGLVWDRLVERSAAEGWAGIECLSGIPGLVGAAPMQNIGAYGQEVAEVIRSVGVLDRRTGEEGRLASKACGFGYRTSLFKTEWRDRYVITDIELTLRSGGMATVNYGDLQKRLGDVPPTLPELRQHVIDIRRSKSMVYDPTDPNHRSAGSFFMNPIVPQAAADAIGLPNMPTYPAGQPGMVKLSAAWLMERAGFLRGHVQGRAGLSTNHVLALINRGDARAGEILALAQAVQAGVRERFGIDLHPEPNLLGF